MRPESSEYFAGTGRKELSECHNRSASLKNQNSVFSRHDVPVLVEVGEIGDARAEALLLAFSDMPRRVVALQLAEMPGECDLLFVGDVLIAEDQHGILVHAHLDRGNLLLGERPSAIDTLNFPDEDRMELMD